MRHAPQPAAPATGVHRIGVRDMLQTIRPASQWDAMMPDAAKKRFGHPRTDAPMPAPHPVEPLGRRAAPEETRDPAFVSDSTC